MYTKRQPSDMYLIPIILTCPETVGQRLGTKFAQSFFTSRSHASIS